MRYLRFIFGVCALSMAMATTALSNSLEYQAGEAAAFLDYCGEDDLKRNLHMRYRNSDDYKKSKMLNTYIGSTGSQDRFENVDCYQWESFASKLIKQGTVSDSSKNTINFNSLHLHKSKNFN